MLDLRQPKTGVAWEYRFGWLDAPQQILYANFAILVSYVEKELGGKIPEPENDWEGAEVWNAHYKEVKALYQYWKVDRAEMQKKLTQMSTLAFSFRKEHRNFAEGERLYKKLSEEQQKFDDFETEALIRLIKTRGGMWT